MDSPRSLFKSCSAGDVRETLQVVASTDACVIMCCQGQLLCCLKCCDLFSFLNAACCCPQFTRCPAGTVIAQLVKSPAYTIRKSSTAIINASLSRLSALPLLHALCQIVVLLVVAHQQQEQ